MSPHPNYTCYRNQLRMAELKPDCWPGKINAMSAIAIWRDNLALDPALAHALYLAPSPGFYGDFRTKPDETRTRLRNYRKINDLRCSPHFPAVRNSKSSTKPVQNSTRRWGVFIFKSYSYSGHTERFRTGELGKIFLHLYRMGHSSAKGRRERNASKMQAEGRVRGRRTRPAW